MFKILSLDQVTHAFKGYHKEGGGELAATGDAESVLRISDINQAFNEAAAISENTTDRICIELEI